MNGFISQTQSIMPDVPLKHLDKLYSVNDGIVKAQIIDYYIKAAQLVLPHITDKPFSMIHFPQGVGGKSFYQKQCPPDAPSWLKRVALPSSKRGFIDWCNVDSVQSIVYMANRSVMEMHTWFSRLGSLDAPDIAVIDLDPAGDTGFLEALILARAFGVLLKELKLYAVPKTSGGSGIHIYIPIIPVSFEDVREFLNKLCNVVVATYPYLATTERVVKKRGDRVYLDAVQNAAGKTIIAPYSLRARPKLPVSTPLRWEELENDALRAEDYNICNIFSRLQETGDLMQDFYKKAQKLPKI